MTPLTSVGFLAAVVAVAYLFCVRPIRRGSRPTTPAMQRAFRVGLAGGTVTDLDTELASAREELARLRGRVPLPAPVAHKRDASVDGRDASVGAALAGPATLARSARPSSFGGDVTGWRRHFPVNMSRAEQVARVAAGLLIAAMTGLVVPGAVVGAWGVILVVVGWLAAADLVVSGLSGHCPLHRFVRLPWDPGVKA
ncbi:MAG: DUF2892 domain-containing protein [Actinomycetota bacterium]|nr:DUF2892 domain-containing protein [Actinomycetota bacterium]